MKHDPLLSVIIPFRCETESSYYLINRLEDLSNSFPKDLPIEFIVVDSASKPIYREECKRICEETGTKYLFHNSIGQSFSIGACRDYGAEYAEGKAVTFLDVDLRVSCDFWFRLLELINAWGISKYKKSFLAIPCLYLTQEGTIEFLKQDTNCKDKFLDFYLQYLQGSEKNIENFAFCSSVMIVDRQHYLSLGGHDVDFRGHGYEDFEFYHRLLCEEGIIPKTYDYYVDQKTWKTSTYKGFRSHLAIIGRPAMMLGLFVVHLWHPRPKDSSFYSKEKLTSNRNIWVEKFKVFEETGINPEPLVNRSITNDNVLFFAKSYKSPSARAIRDLLPSLGKVIYVDENEFIGQLGELDTENFCILLQQYDIKKIIFPNPYGNLARLEIYKWCKKSNFPFYCYDRGALPDSWFLDNKGFNFDSSSYSEDYWNLNLSADQEDSVDEYILNIINGNNFLEQQSKRIGKEALSNKLLLGSKKVLFVPFQRPSDTVIKYMSGDVRSFNRFLKIIDHLAKKLKSIGWVVLCKKHPLETDTPILEYVQYVDEDTNFIDLLELADSVALINSGVGIYAMMMGKPCYIFGNAFYSINGVNKKVIIDDPEDGTEISKLAKIITAKYEVDQTKMKRFIHYLINSFYSFGKASTSIIKERDGSLRAITSHIDFYDFKLNGNVIFKYERSRDIIPLWAPMYERYSLDIHMRKQEDKKKIETKKLATSQHKDKGTIVKPNEGNVNVKKEVKNKVLGDVVNSKPQKKGVISISKIKKFKKDPYKFFADAKNPLIRSFKNFYKK